MVDQDMEATVIYQRLTQAPHCFKGSYHAVYRYIRKHFKPSVEAAACIPIETKSGEAERPLEPILKTLFTAVFLRQKEVNRIGS